jgi:hypothetical protein
MSEFISENDLNTFEGWLKYQAIDPAILTPDELQQWKSIFDENQKNKDPKMGLLKLKARPGEKLYGVAVRDDGNLWLVLWVRRNRKGEFFVMVPRAKSGWDPHNSYHLDGTFHAKSFGHKLEVQQRQRLDSTFRGTEHLGAHGGYGPVAARRGALQCVNRVLRSLPCFVVSEVLGHVVKIFLFLGQHHFKKAFGLLNQRQSLLDLLATRFIHARLLAAHRLT